MRLCRCECWVVVRLTQLTFYVPINTKRSFQRRSPKPVSWLGMEKTKPNTTKAHIHQSKERYNNTK